jgi:hypothetical protein
MAMRTLGAALVLTTLLSGGCRSSSNYCAPAVVATRPACPTAVIAAPPAPCCNNPVGQVPPPPAPVMVP